MRKTTKRFNVGNVGKVTLLLMIFSTTTLFSHSLGSKRGTKTNKHLEMCLSTADRVKVTKFFVTELPSISVQPSASAQSVCINGAFASLSITASDATTYAWFKNDVASTVGGTLVGTNSPVYLPLSNEAGTYYYYCVVSNSEGAVTSEVSGEFLVSNYPNPGEVTGVGTICTNGTTTYTSDGDAGGFWTSNDVNVVTINLTSGVITPVGVGSTMINYTAVSAGACPNSKAFKTVIVSNTLNAGVISGVDNLCTGITATYTSDGDVGGVWSSNDTDVAVIDASTGVVTPLSAGTITVSYTVSVLGCTPDVTTKNITVFVSANAGVLSGNDAICLDGTSVFVTTGDAGGSWSSSDTDIAVVSPLTGAISAVGEGDAEIVYTVLGSNGCPNDSAELNLMVAEYAYAGDIEGTQNVCPGYFCKDIMLSSFNGDIVKWQIANDIDFTSPTDIDFTDSVLTSEQIGLLTETKYVRAVVGSACGTVYSDVVTLAYGQTTTWDGVSWSDGTPDITKKVIINGLYDMTTKSSFEACACDVQAMGELIITSNKYVTLDKGLFNDNIVTIRNAGMLVQIDDEVANEEAITVERHTTPMLRHDFTYWSSPVAGETLVDLTTSNLFYGFNTDLNSWVSLAGSTEMMPGIGYVARAPGSFSTTQPTVYSDGKFIGVPNNGTISVEVSNSEANKWNLIGNPYPSAINIETFLNLNSDLLDSTIYLWTHNSPSTGFSYSSNDYASLNLLGGISVCNDCPKPSKNIASGQGFFVAAKNSGSVVFNNSMRHRSYDNTQFYRTNTTEELERHRFWLNLTNENGAFKEILIGYLDGATNSFDSSFDGENFNANNFVNLYSINEAKKLTIQARALPFDSMDVIPVGFSTTITGVFSISLDSFDGLFEAQNVYLKDNLMETTHNLSTGSYSFATAVGTFDERFEIVYQASPLLSTPSFLASNVVLYKEQESVVINSGSIVMDKIKVYDVQGRLVLEKEHINGTETSFSIGVSNQLLLIQIQSETGEVITKKII